MQSRKREVCLRITRLLSINARLRFTLVFQRGERAKRLAEKLASQLDTEKSANHFKVFLSPDRRALPWFRFKTQ